MKRVLPKGKRGGKRPGAGRPLGSFKPWDHITIAERFYSRFWELTIRGVGRNKAIQQIFRETYAADHPENISDDGQVRYVYDKGRDRPSHYERYCETQAKLISRGHSEDQSMTDGHWDEWFQARRRNRLKNVPS